MTLFAHNPSKPVEAILHFGRITFDTKHEAVQSAQLIKWNPSTSGMSLELVYDRTACHFVLTNTPDDHYEKFIQENWVEAIN